MKPQVLPVEEAFDAAREKFEEIVDQLCSPQALEMDHGELETLINAEGMELLRRLLQGHLDFRGTGEVGASLMGSDGVVRSHRRMGSRRLMSVFGEVDVSRMRYGGRGTTSLVPLDAELNLPVELYSHGVRKRVAQEVAKNSYDDAVDSVSSTTGASVPKRQVEELAMRASADFEAFYQRRGVVSKSTGELVVISVDGKGIVMRTEDLREQTRNKALSQVHKLSKRLSRGEKRNAKRMATVATVYGIERFARQPADIVAELRPVGQMSKTLGTEVKRPRPENKRVWASVQRPPEVVIAQAFAEALRRDPDHKKQWVALVDGNETQLRLLKEQAARSGIVIVLDLIHVLEYLWKAAFVFHKEGSEEAEAWVTERLMRLLHGNSGHVAAGIRRSATLRNLSCEQRLAADKCADYLLKYAEYLRYDRYLEEGLPIATGVIEGACRHLIKDRMDLTGARWSLAGAEAVLRLRSLRSSGDFEEYWRFHIEQELERNHVVRYDRAIRLAQRTDVDQAERSVELRLVA
jgi:hypothetical protein